MTERVSPGQRCARCLMEIALLHLSGPAQEGADPPALPLEVTVLHFGSPSQEGSNPGAVLPEQAEELLPGEGVGRHPEESLHAPAQVGALPGPQPVALRDPPEVPHPVDQHSTYPSVIPTLLPVQSLFLPFTAKALGCSPVPSTLSAS